MPVLFSLSSCDFTHFEACFTTRISHFEAHISEMKNYFVVEDRIFLLTYYRNECIFRFPDTSNVVKLNRSQTMIEATVTEVKYITIERASELLNKSPHSVRQLMDRRKLVRHTEGFKVLLEIDSVLSYYARKKSLPSWEENISKVQSRSFLSGAIAASTLGVQESYLIKLIRKNLIEGYVTIAGEIMISKDSINAYLRKPNANDSSSL